MKSKQIIIVTEQADLHADDMIHMLRAKGHEPVRLNTDDIPLNTILTFYYNTNMWNGAIEIQTNKRFVDINNLQSIWWRRPGPFRLPHELSEQERGFAKEEIDHVLSGLWASLDCYWMSFPENIRQAGWKMEQLQRAAKFGLEVPRTLITTNPNEAHAFYEVCDGKMVFKVMTDIFLGVQKFSPPVNEQGIVELYGTYTTLINDTDLDQIESVRYTPCLFQEYIPKLLEFRITIIGDDVFAAEIHSQANEKTRIDWRHYDVNIPYRKATLPVDILDRCLAFVRSYNLNFSAIDMILTPDGRYVFIENNPNGQFMFIEKLLPELEMTSALASCLIRGSNS